MENKNGPDRSVCELTGGTGLGVAEGAIVGRTGVGRTGVGGTGEFVGTGVGGIGESGGAGVVEGVWVGGTGVSEGMGVSVGKWAVVWVGVLVIPGWGVTVGVRDRVGAGLVAMGKAVGVGVIIATLDRSPEIVLVEAEIQNCRVGSGIIFMR
jgi:hypothetical protein